MNSLPDTAQKTDIYLLGQSGSLAGRRIDLGEGQVLIGRDHARCRIVLPQSIISIVQASIEITAQRRAFIKNLSSKDTTFVNGIAVAESELQSGDVIGFGDGGIMFFSFRKEISAGFDSSRIDENGRGESEFATVQIPAVKDFQPPPQSEQQATTMLRLPNVKQIRIGRALDNDVVLDALSVSRYHAVLTYGGDGGSQPTITDSNSANGTFVNGEHLIEPRVISARDLISVGNYLLVADGREITAHDLGASRITAYNVCKSIGGNSILKDISLSFYPREFVGLMGPSGCGKSTLMDALNGLRPATSGSVFVNDLDLYLNFDALRRSIGYVPQKDVLHDALNVERTLYYAAKLRLPRNSTRREIRRVVDETVEIVGLKEHRRSPFRQLSGGQQKRLSLAIELITKPSFIFLDEPTSPLDPETTENMMLLFRRLADEGRIVVMVTHKFEKFREMRRIVMLTKGGRLAFFGTPQESLEYFGVKEPGEIYHRIAEREPEHWESAFRSSPEYRRHISNRIAETNNLLAATREKGVDVFAGQRQGGTDRKFGFGQWLTLTRRYLEIKLKDKRNTLLLLIQAPIVAFILAMIVGDAPNDSKTLFISAIIAIWFGANNAVREIVSESTIYTRERLVNLKIPSYVFSKFAVLSGVGLIQCLMFISILIGTGKLKGADFPMLTVILYATLLTGAAAGLFISALVGSTEKAMSVLPLILIPQLLLSGFLKPLDDFYVNLKTGKPAASEAFREYEDERKKADENKIPEKQTPPQNNSRAAAPQNLPAPVLLEPVAKYEGLGVARYAAALMIARWTIDGLAHQVSGGDKEARDKLAASMTIAAYRNVLDNKSESDIEKAYRARVSLDVSVLILFCFSFLALTIFALKRKDVL